MKKIELSWDGFKNCCRQLADEIELRLPIDSKAAIVGINRGGMIPAVVIAKMLRMEVIPWTPLTNLSDDIHRFTHLIFIDDLYAQGRTYAEYERKTNDLKHATTFMTILMDGKAHNPKVYYAMRSDDWIVFPWEDIEAVTAGDRGLFRERTDVYGEG